MCQRRSEFSSGSGQSGIARSGDQGPVHQIPQIAENVLARHPILTMRGDLLHELLGGLLIEELEIELALVQLAERDECCQSQTAVSRVERHILQKSENQRCSLLGEGRKGIPAEHSCLRALNGIEEAELGFDQTRRGLMAAELQRQRTVKLDDVLSREITDRWRARPSRRVA